MKNSALVFALALSASALAQPVPVIESWVLNTTSQTGYGNIASNVQLVQYTTTDVYVTCTCIPGYDIGPWAGNPNTPANQNFCFKITRSPQANTGTLITTGLGHIGVWSNGVSIFNAKDAFSYNNQGIWNQDALVNEGSSFDNCLGHPAPNGEYHHHVNPTCLYDDLNSQMHSPIIGYAFDGYPIYGAYGYTNPMQPGAVSRMRSGYALRNITQRTSLPNGTTLQASQYGPAVSGTSPLGKYIEDYEFLGNGDLDEHNGRFCITPEYPNGTYAYFVTIDANAYPVFPYVIGPQYYGTVPNGNTGPQGGHNTVPGNAVTYNPTVGVEEAASAILPLLAYPNPTMGQLIVSLPGSGQWTAMVSDATGRTVAQFNGSGITGSKATFDLQGHTPGVYSLTILQCGLTAKSRITLL